ncbi:putative signal peptide protein [Halorubrum sp. AJ67]|nr:putative signal peptide protein [Halorubrum sp. AJ67]
MNTAEAPAARRAHARCALQSLTPFAPSSASVACARLAAAPSIPTPHSTATAPHTSPASSVAVASLRRLTPSRGAPRALKRALGGARHRTDLAEYSLRYLY